MTNTPRFNFGIKPTTSIADIINAPVIKNIQVNKLVAFRNHPFKLYEGQQFDDMVKSVKERGILLPIIVRQIDGENYEILSGHNRTEAAKAAGLDVVPVIVRENLTDEEAMLIVTETNLIQRSFSDLSYSERAVILASHYEAIKHQGKRTDLINEIENLLKSDGITENNAAGETSRTLCERIGTDKKLANDYDMSSRNISNYLRINKLIDSLKRRLDNNEFAFRAAVEISYLSDDEQDSIDMLLDSPMYRLDMKKSAQLRECSAKKRLSTNDVENILYSRNETFAKTELSGINGLFKTNNRFM